jgi:hypothetical protein
MYVSSSLGLEVDSVLLMAGAAGAIVGLLYFRPPDKIIDYVIEIGAGYCSWHDLRPSSSKRVCNEELKRFIAAVDYLVSTWRTPSWESLEDSCRYSVSSAISDLQIQKEIWKLKNRSAIGLTFLLWGLVLLRVGLEPSWMPLLSACLGVVFLILPWIGRSAKNLPIRVRRVASLRYAKDTFPRWRALGDSMSHQIKIIMQKLADDAKEIERTIAEGQWERLDRMHTWFLHELDRHNSRPYDVRQRLGEVWARAIIDIVGTQNGEKDAQKEKARYISALEIFRINGQISSYPWADALTESDLSDLKRLIAAGISWNDIKQYYSRFLRDLAHVFNGIQDNTMKVEWINAVVETGWPLPVELQKVFFMFTCMYEGNAIQDSAYELFTKNHDLPFENVSELMIDRFASMVGIPDKDAQNTTILKALASLLERNDIKPDVKKRIIHHAEKYSSIGSWMSRYLGGGWKRKALL